MENTEEIGWLKYSLVQYITSTSIILKGQLLELALADRKHSRSARYSRSHLLWTFRSRKLPQRPVDLRYGCISLNARRDPTGAGEADHVDQPRADPNED
jgi:hypothetical protein